LRGRKCKKLREIGIISGVADDVRQNIRKGMIKMISLKIREKETEKTVRRAIKICQDKEKSRKSIQSLLSIMATERHLIPSWSP